MFRRFFNKPQGETMSTLILSHKPTAQGIRGQAGFLRRPLNFSSIENVGFAEIIVNERWPEDGYMENVLSDIVLRVLTGCFYLYLHDRDAQFFPKGETIHIPKGTLHYIVQELPAVLLEISTPTWSDTQQKIVTL